MACGRAAASGRTAALGRADGEAAMRRTAALGVWTGGGDGAYGGAWACGVGCF